MAGNKVICITRQFGSGGHEVGIALAKTLGIKYYDKELLSAAAEKSGITQEIFEKNDEKPASGIGILGGSKVAAKAGNYADYVAYMPNDQMQNVIAEVIREAAEKGSCVIIGRCADYVLRGEQNMLSVFVHAREGVRVQRIAKLHNMDEDAARALIRKTDHSRANYYNHHTGRNWGAVDNYDLAVDAERFGTQGAVNIIKQAVQLL